MKCWVRRVVLALIAVGPLGFNTASANAETDAEPLRLLQITPAGEDVAPGRQVVLQFDRDVVPLGRMQRDAKEIPVTIEPALACEWRWLSTSALACQLREEHAMRPATQYRVVVTTKSLDSGGAHLAEAVEHSFITARPRVTYSRFVNWLSPGTPLIQLTFNQPVTRNSVENALLLRYTDASPTQAVKLIAWPDDLPRERPWWMHGGSQRPSPAVDDRAQGTGGEQTRRVWLVEPRRELPLDTTMRLDVIPGLRPAEGNEPGVENRTVVSFDTFPEFEVLGLRCTPRGETRPRDILLTQLQGVQSEHALRCAPLSGVALLFSAPVPNSVVKQHVEFAPPLDRGLKDYDPWLNSSDWTRLSAPHRKGQSYRVWLPGQLLADRQYDVRFSKVGVRDEFGRLLGQAVALRFFTAHREPDLNLAHQVAVLEHGVDSDVPVVLTNLERVAVEFDRLQVHAQASGLRTQLPALQVEDIAYELPLGVRDMLGGESGLIFARLNPVPLPKNWYRAPTLLAQVTPFQVHYKAGHFNSLAWVTRFADGKPVAGASVSLWKGAYTKLAALEELGFAATTNTDGLAVLPGLATLDPDLQHIYGGRSEAYPGFFARVEQGDDLALLPLNGQFSIWSSGVSSISRPQFGHSRAWGTSAQGVYRQGENVQFKIYLRDQSNRRWVKPDRAGYRLQVMDPGDKVVFELENLALNEFGAFHAEFKLAKSATVGWYRFVLSPMVQPNKNYQQLQWEALRVLVSDFTPAPFKVSAELNGTSFTVHDQVDITALATMYAGGPYTNADIRLTARLRTKPFRSDHPLAAGFEFGAGDKQSPADDQQNLLDVRGRLDAQGEHAEQFKLPDSNVIYGELTVEASVMDDRGKFVASTARADYTGRDRFVGLKNSQWLYRQGEVASLLALVVDREGAPLANVPIEVVINRRESRAARVKGPGNAFLTRNILQWVEQDRCFITSGAEPTACDFIPSQPGYYEFVATVRDSQDRAHQSRLHGWVVGVGQVLWPDNNDSVLEIIPEQREYQVGDTARYLIKNPFPGAKALVTVERYGILESRVETLQGNTPVIEIPIEQDYLPGFYLSVVALSPRVEAPPGAGKVDLGKPAYRQGYIQTNVVERSRRLRPVVTTASQTYKPREQVQASIKIDRSLLPADAKVELAVAVVDESVLALNRSGRGYYDPYRGFNHLDSLDVQNYGLISRLLGRQEFEKKGANPGGGGASPVVQLRDDFRFVSYWNPSLRPDADGNAEFEFAAPDNLTGWRILAIAMTPHDLMGLGDTSFKVNRPTEIRPLMPNQVTAGDRFQAGFSVMNRTAQDRQMKVGIKITGKPVLSTAIPNQQRIVVPAFSRKNVWVPIETRQPGMLDFNVTAGDGEDYDGLVHRLPVKARFSLESAVNYGSTTASTVSAAVRVPAGIEPGVGSIGATLSPSVLGNLDGAFRYLRDYPFQCWEQRVSKALGASHFNRLQTYLSPATTWSDASSSIESMLDSAAEYQAPNGGMAYWQADNQQVSPYLSAYTAQAFNWLREAGHAVPRQVEEKLHEYLLRLLRRDELPGFYTRGMASSVRAAALAALAQAGHIGADEVYRYQPQLPLMDLFGKAHFLQAALDTGADRLDTVKLTLDSILGHASQSGGKIQFNEPWDDSYKYLLATPQRANCAILSALVAARAADVDTAQGIGDMPSRLVRAITQTRANRDHWQNTQENVYCLQALDAYASVYEAKEPALDVTVSFAGESIGSARFGSLKDPQVIVQRDLQADDAGREAQLVLGREGVGRLYYATRLSYADPDAQSSRVNAGIELRREYSVERDGQFIRLQDPMQLKRGELVRIDLFLSVPTARHFVVVEDPVPGGLEPVNSDLATASQVDADKADFKAAEESWYYRFDDWGEFGRYFWSFHHRELRHDAARYFADYLPAGNYHLSYTAQAIASGEFSVQPVHAEEMYDPDIYGRGVAASLRVTD